MSHKNIKYNWIALQADYLTGEYSAKELAQKHNIKLATLNGRIQHYGWAKARSAARAKNYLTVIPEDTSSLAKQRQQWISEVLQAVNGHKLALDLTTIKTLKDRQTAIICLKTLDEIASKRLGLDQNEGKTIFNVIALSNLSDKSEST